MSDPQPTGHRAAAAATPLPTPFFPPRPPTELFNLFNASHKPRISPEDFGAVYTPLAAAQHRGASAAAAPDSELQEAMDALGAISARATFEAVSAARRCSCWPVDRACHLPPEFGRVTMTADCRFVCR